MILTQVGFFLVGWFDFLGVEGKRSGNIYILYIICSVFVYIYMYHMLDTYSLGFCKEVEVLLSVINRADLPFSYIYRLSLFLK